MEKGLLIAAFLAVIGMMDGKTIFKRATDEDKVCKFIDVSSDLGGITEGVFEASKLFFKISETVPVIGTSIATGIAIVNFFTGNSLSSDCSDKPFDEIKKILGNRFDKVEKSLDRNYQAIKVVSAQVSQIKLEVQQGFGRVLQSIKSSRIEPMVLKLNSFIEFFSNEKGRINDLPHHEYIKKLKEEDSILIRLKASRIPMYDSLHTSLNEIADGGYAIPEGFNDTIASNALNALCYGTQTYISIMHFLLDQYFYLAQYHYENFELDAFNNCIDTLKSTFNDFSYSLIGISNSGALIPQVIRTLHKVEDIFAKNCSNNALCKFARDNIVDLNNEIEKIKQMKLPFIADVPEKFNGKIHFSNSDIETPIGEWIKGAKVQYATQYEKNGILSEIGDWSGPYIIGDKANPTIKIYFDPKNYNRLIFRRFNDKAPQLVGIIKGENGRYFRDINRDILNAASRLNEDIAVNEMNRLINHGANIDAEFEGGKRAIHAAVETNNMDLGKYILEKSIIAINIPDSKGRTPLHFAAEVGNEDFIEFLIAKGANVNVKTKNGLSPLHIATKKGNKPVINALLKSPNVNVNERANNSFTPLHSAIVGGYHAVETLLLNNDVNINAQSDEGLTPLHLASIKNDLVAITTLIKTIRNCNNSIYCKIDVNIGNKNKMTALHFASMFGHLDIVKYLISQDSTNINALTNDHKLPLHYAISFKRKEVAMELLANKRMNLKLLPADQKCPLHLAIETRQNEIAKKLLRLGAEKDAKTKDGFTALHIAVKYKNFQMTSLLIYDGAEIDAKTHNGLTALHFAAESNDEKTVKYLLEKNADAEAVDSNGLTPIQRAVMNNSLEVVRELSEHRLSLMDVKNDKGESLIHLAVKKSNLDMIKYLIDKGCDGNEQNNNHETPLCYAIKENNLKLVYYFFERGIHIPYHEDFSCIYKAVENGNLDIVKFFYKNKKTYYLESSDSRRVSEIINLSDRIFSKLHFLLIDSVRNNKISIFQYLVDDKEVVVSDFFGCFLLIESCKGGLIDFVKYFYIDKGIKLDCNQFEKDLTDLPLYSAIINNHTGVMKYLVDKGAWIDSKAKGYDKIPLRSAIKIGNLDMVIYLIRKGAFKDWRHWWVRDDALHDAASYGHLDIVMYLVDTENMRIDAGGDRSNTPLHKAAILSNDPIAEDRAETVMKYLLIKGAKITQNSDNKTPFELASPRVRKNTEQYLKILNSEH